MMLNIFEFDDANKFYIIVLTSVLGGSIIGWLLNVLVSRLFVLKTENNHQKQQKRHTSSPFGINAYGSPKTAECDHDHQNAEKAEENVEVDGSEEQDSDDHNEKISSRSNPDSLNSTLGKFHGKLATAQLKAISQQISSEMSKEEIEQSTVDNHVAHSNNTLDKKKDAAKPIKKSLFSDSDSETDLFTVGSNLSGRATNNATNEIKKSPNFSSTNISEEQSDPNTNEILKNRSRGPQRRLPSRLRQSTLK
uniref:Uncharacterized protein n=2 Tax=Caenorhabditis japonica TaxID=281687 RepID=A0A8R1HXQ6_CAEJA